MDKKYLSVREITKKSERFSSKALDKRAFGGYNSKAVKKTGH